MILLHHPWSRAALVTASIASLLAACGGKVVVDAEDTPGTGGTAATTSSVGAGGIGTSGTTGISTTTGNTTTGGNSKCSGLQKDVEATVATAQACNPALSSLQCSGALAVRDTCGCVVVANEKTPEAAQLANMAFETWIGAGCGPFPCESCPPGPDSPWFCDPNLKTCRPAFEK